MRPYQINTPHGPWVDLDHVLELNPVRVSGTWTTITWRAAFTRRAREYSVAHSPPLAEWVDLPHEEVRPALERLTRPDAMWQAFFDAWKGGV